ncbi:protein TSSC4 [Sebastes umbrosus]|uniref:protein TSSC4 n=1 Tax=Sebastes umbrosus TaxID=72105 RepID=UPI00189DED18|nr:protein TSSC4 [Sebastes umbrosus]XP_037650770.1 protein TSSC4 [Sebastes umbrosus]XP_037650779.1 protein TSSC4 [Sebastes umbrosus]XP_037650787.1 protein TSSC4 [Sebastes umbrosus]
MCDQKNGSDRGEMLNSDDTDELSASDESEPEERPSGAPFDPELDDDDDDDDEEAVITAPVAGHRAQSSFSLRGGGSAFSNRSHSIFECLDSVARLASSSLSPDNVTDGVFARPLPPRPSRKTIRPPPSCPTPAKKKGVPDYLVHPERWTHYSLEDVPETCDQGNSRAAHNFLSSLQQTKEQQTKEKQTKEQQESRSDTSCNVGEKMIFSRPSGLLKEQPANQLSSVSGKEKETRLSHLEEEHEDEDGKEKEKAGGRRIDQSVEKAEERARDEEKDTRGAMGRPDEKKPVQKEKEEEEEEEDMEEVNPAFTSFRKTKRKNYRKGSGREDN